MLLVIALWSWSLWYSIEVSYGFDIGDIFSALLADGTVQLTYDASLGRPEDEEISGTWALWCQREEPSVDFDGRFFWLGGVPHVSYSRGVIELDLPLWMAVLAIFVVMAVISYRRRRPPSRGCPNCGYDLRGNTSGRCPECGTACVGNVDTRRLTNHVRTETSSVLCSGKWGCPTGVVVRQREVRWRRVSEHPLDEGRSHGPRLGEDRGSRVL